MNDVTREALKPEDGYELWLRYLPISDDTILAAYRARLTQAVFDAPSATLQAAREELSRGLKGLLGVSLPLVDQPDKDGTLLVGTPQSSSLIAQLELQEALAQVSDEGFVILRQHVQGSDCIVIAANSDIGVLYGVFHFLRLLQTHRALDDLDVVSAPKIQTRMLNHWDNLDRHH